MSFLDIYNRFSVEEFRKIIEESDAERVSALINREGLTSREYFRLLSKGAEGLLGQMAAAAQALTIKRFGKVINFYAPLYLSNECYNSCVYCGFNHQREIPRVTLSMEEVEIELKALKECGFDSVLLLTGEAPKTAGKEYIKEAVKLAKRYFTFVGLEIYPMSVEDYRELVEAGADGLTIYQETFDRETYDRMHISGKKKDFEWRLTTPERALEAGFRKIGLGSLLGLADWRYEAAMLGLQIDYLRKRYWKSEITLSFPRINPIEAGDEVPAPVSDREMVQMICAARLFLEETGFVLSTRESRQLRDNLIGLCITQISAGSKTNPGGYTNCEEAVEQFDVSDDRGLDEMVKLVESKGYDPVIKDWEKDFTGVN